MNLAEASRQYQATLEANRKIREHFDGVLSAEEIVADAEDELAQARRVLNEAHSLAALNAIPTL